MARMTPLADQLARVLSGFPEIRLALLFGSQSEGRARPGSDVDVAVLPRSPLDASQRQAIIEAIALATGCAVDLVDLSGGPEPILGEALQGTLLLGDSRTRAELMSRHVFNVADFLPLRQRILAERRARWIP